ncbi:MULTISPECIES: ImmA/IrrE family metallo-endopeptidase [unclassified Gordonia (in: high G+C Gram-positive bacteria)]|uniref:ImmA/IrrE family metallo-endopeptidase n=1 Tax=unclassified Gordonia (in: high G+C Gram-positive bacteria) TaxID=2657482 RepID=UPI00071C5903|nr:MULTISPECIES: ImmA/IrrE family metallo-endopeptidase [unclassified Gordonia (in: high G+C Gram-positive bacteria)]KSU53334.1 hypothetical protein AS181_22140 [Gordonia sp. SGD-V-85]SCC56135.1 protein of unknown function [Gordonia sp. v-85]
MYNHLPAPTLRNLRRMMPRFAMSYPEALRAAERQAVRLARAFNADRHVVSKRDLLSITRVEIHAATTVAKDYPASGHCYYERGRWVIVVDTTEPLTRQRFTVAHELKHIIDAGCAVERIYARLSASQIEQVCDHFAACLLMSKQAVYHLWGEGLRTPEALAMACHVSVRAMKRRMAELGLPLDIEEPSRLDLHLYCADTFPDADGPDTLPTPSLPEPSTGAPA